MKFFYVLRKKSAVQKKKIVGRGKNPGTAAILWGGTVGE